MSYPATPYTRHEIAQAQSSVSKPGITWACTIDGLISDADGMKIYAVLARKTPFHAIDANVPYLYIPTSLGEDELPVGSTIFCHRIYRTVNGALMQFFIPAENPYLI